MSVDQIFAALPADKDAIKKTNSISAFYPIRNQKNNIDFETIAGHLLGLVIGKRLDKALDLERYRDDCMKHLATKLYDKQVLAKIDKMYFPRDIDGALRPDALYSVSPDFYLFKANDNPSKGTLRVAKLLTELLQASNYEKTAELQTSFTFIEAQLYEVLRRHLEPQEIKRNHEQLAYLPFLTDLFNRDLDFLVRHSSYFLAQIKNFLSLYTFLYCSQLALNINAWPMGEPVSKRLFFILDSEKASIERVGLRTEGYNWLRDRVADVFPVLVVLEYLNEARSTFNSTPVPLWYFGQLLSNSSAEQRFVANHAIRRFAEAFREARGLLDQELPATEDPIESLKQLIRLSKHQFKDLNSDRGTVYQRYVKAFQQEVAVHFVQNRRAGGNVLVLNQDMLLLLTNLAIGEETQLRFHELLQQFNARGIYFDKQSEQALINFYERIGNVDRKSDSGDAVYVRKTI